MSQSDENNKAVKSKETVEVILAEYQALKTTALESYKIHLQIYTVLLGSIGIVLGYAFVSQAYDILLILPAISIAFLYRWLWDQNIILGTSYYIIVELERKKIPALLGYFKADSPNYRKYWLGYEQFWIDNNDNEENPVSQLHMKTVLIVFLLPLFLSIWRTLVYIQPILLSNAALDWFLAVQIVLNVVYALLFFHVFRLHSRLNQYYRNKESKETY